MTYDLAIIGAGQAGIKAAEHAVELGLKTVLIEQGFIGGTCLNSGCVPTKFLLGATSTLASINAQHGRGALEGTFSCNFDEVQRSKETFLANLRSEAQTKLEALGVSILKGKAKFTDTTTIMVGTGEKATIVKFKNAIVATGSAPISFPSIKPDGESVLTSSGIIGLKKAPGSLVILGGGAIGVELGELFYRLGTKIIIVEGNTRIVGTEEPEISEALKNILLKKGWEIHTGKPVSSLATVDGKSCLTFADGATITADKALISIGRKPVTKGLELESIGVSISPRGFIEVDEHFRTNIANIYALGDVNGKVMMAHVAGKQALVAISHLAGEKIVYNFGCTPTCIHGDTELMRVGPSLAELKAAGHSVSISRASLANNTFVQAAGHDDGFVSVAWVDGKIAAISAIGRGVSHLIMQSTIMVNESWTKNKVKSLLFPIPTIDEALESAILNKQELL